MPLIKPRTNRVQTVRHIARLQEPNRDALVHYARFIGDTADYVLNQLIDTTIAKDREFVAWRSGQSPDVLANPPRLVVGVGRGRKSNTRRDEGVMQWLIEYRFVISLGLSALVGVLGLQAWPFPGANPILGLVHEMRPTLYAAFNYTYATAWFSTPFFLINV